MHIDPRVKYCPLYQREKAEPTRDLARLTGQPGRLRFELVDADLYSVRFR